MSEEGRDSLIPTEALHWLRPLCVLAYVAGVAAVIIGILLDARVVLGIAAVLLLVGLCAMAACCIATGSAQDDRNTQ